VQLVEALAEPLQVVQGVGPLGMPGQLGPLPVREVGEEIGLQLVELLLQLLPLLGLGGVHLHGADLGFQLQHRLFQLGEIHGLFGGRFFHAASSLVVRGSSVGGQAGIG